MLKTSQSKNVLSCRLKAAWDGVLRIDLGRWFHAADQRKRNFAQQTWYASTGERSRLFQLTVDVHALSPSLWIVQHQRCTMGNGCSGRRTLNCRLYTVHELALVTSEVV